MRFVRFFPFLLRVCRFFAAALLLYLASLVLYAVGRPKSLREGHQAIKNVLQKFLKPIGVWPAKTEEERQDRIVARINVRMTLLGFSVPEYIRYRIRRAILGKRMTNFLQKALKEIKVGVGASFLEFAAKDDMAFVIGATSYLDRYLAIALIGKFSGELSENNYKELFEGYGPLAAFSAKIKAAKALGLVIGDMQHDLTILRKLRNDFAHSAGEIKLKDGEHSARCLALKMTYGLNADILTKCATPERQRFLESVAANVIHLAVLIQRGVVERKYLQANFSAINSETQALMKEAREKAKAVAPAT
jgi:hypothetical protein